MDISAMHLFYKIIDIALKYGDGARQRQIFRNSLVSRYLGNVKMLRNVISNLAIKTENDRYYVIPVVYDF